MSNYIPLRKEDIKILEQNRCYAENWQNVKVTPEFDPHNVREVIFEGDVKIGSLSGKISLPGGEARKAGIFRARLHNVTIGDNCYISNVHIILSNINVESNVCIENVGKIVCTGESTFGNGHEIAVLNEAGGRELKICKETNAQIAYISVFYRDNKQLISRLNKIADNYANELKDSRATVGASSVITNCNEIVNVSIGEAAILNGALSLKEGTIDSSNEAPTMVGNGVIAAHFIFQKGASVAEGAIIHSSLIGEGTQIGKQFSAENSVMFANSEGFHSEVCSIFAGPYTVTHHKSTLLIAGLFSFFNAGSGTNQSNHRYKLGPVHQGILERGCKTGSSSYLLWPSRVGAFTAIIGKHYANFDTSDLPFAYISEVNGKSTIIPGMNFFTTGTLRDGAKWPVRDRRKSASKLDLIIFDVLSPYTVQKMIRGQQILAELYQNSKKGQEYVTYNGIHIKRLLLKTCIRYYKLAIDKYFGDLLIARIRGKAGQNLRDILKYEPGAASGEQEWVDVAGLICAKSRIDDLIEKIVAGEIDSQRRLMDAFFKIYQAYHDDAWNWFLASYKKLHNCELAAESPDNLHNFLDNWKQSSLKLLNMVLQDSQKEFEGAVRISFGIDGNADEDFENVRGNFMDNSFTKKIREAIARVNEDYEYAKQLLPE